MAWLDTVVANLTPILLVMSLLALFVVRRNGLWRGIGGAWLATVVIALGLAVLFPGYWSLDCGWQNLLRSGVGHVTVLNPSPSVCGGDNYLPLWLAALPPLTGIVILASWVWRHTRPAAAAIQSIAILAGCAVVAVGVGQLNENLALLFVVAVAAATEAWPRLPRQRTA